MPLTCTLPLLVPLFSRVDFYLHTHIVASHYFMPLVYLTSGMLVICAIVGCCNATNLMDGLDGLCGGVTAIIAACFWMRP